MNRSWMGTVSGRKFAPFDPHVDDIDIRDIARGLAMTCRYGGQVKRFYSVAEHCYHVSYLVPEKYALHGLLHDSAEAYIGDMIRPIKHAPQMHEFRRAEGLIEEAVAERFGLKWDYDATVAVKEMDDRILINEIRELSYMPDAYLSEHPLNTREPVDRTLYFCSPRGAEACFLIRFEELTGLNVTPL